MIIRMRLHVLLACYVFVIGIVGCSKGPTVPVQTSIQAKLEQLATAQIKQELDVLVTGSETPAVRNEAVFRLNEVRNTRSALESTGIHVASYELSISDSRVEQIGGNFRLQITERSTLHLVAGANEHVETVQTRQRSYTFAPTESGFTIVNVTVDEFGSEQSSTGSAIPIDAVMMDSVTLNSKPKVTPRSTTASLYNKPDAAAYARQWAMGYNPSYTREGNDCANFASQCLKAGGWTFVYTVNPLPWFYTPFRSPYAWVNSHNLFWFTHDRPRGSLVSYQSTLSPGDFVQFDWKSDGYGTINHTMVVTGKDAAGNIYLSGHTNPTLNKSLNQIVAENGGVHVYLWLVHYSFS